MSNSLRITIGDYRTRDGSEVHVDQLKDDLVCGVSTDGRRLIWNRDGVTTWSRARFARPHEKDTEPQPQWDLVELLYDALGSLNLS